MKKTVSLILAVMMLLGCMSVTAFATTVPSWSYDEATDTITINYEIPAGAEVGANVPAPDFLSGDGVNIDSIAFGWGVPDDDAPFIYNGVHWNPLNGTFASGNRYGYVILITYIDTAVDHSDAKVILNGKTYTNLGNGVSGEINYQPLLIVDFGVLGDDGKFTGGDFDETESGNKSGDTTLTATKAEPFSYKISIPTEVPTITAAGVYPVGEAAKAIEVAGATEKTVISYTATTTDFKLSTDESKTMAATYHTEEEATNAFPTDAVKVYENKADVANLPTMWVKIADSDWNAAEAGTYHATVTFNFEAEEAEPVLSTVADVLATVPGGFPTSAESSTWSNGNSCLYVNTVNNNLFAYYSDSTYIMVPLDTELTKTDTNKYSCNADPDVVLVFEMSESKFNSVTINSDTLSSFEDFPNLVGTYREAK